MSSAFVDGILSGKSNLHDLLCQVSVVSPFQTLGSIIGMGPDGHEASDAFVEFAVILMAVLAVVYNVLDANADINEGSDGGVGGIFVYFIDNVENAVDEILDSADADVVRGRITSLEQLAEDVDAVLRDELQQDCRLRKKGADVDMTDCHMSDYRWLL